MAFLAVTTLIAAPCVGQTIIPLGTNPDTGLQEIRVMLPGLPEGSKPLDMVRVPAGTFYIGSGSSPQDANVDEEPRHQVTITEPFYLGKYEVTQMQWLRVMGNNPSSFSGRPDNPVEQVSWDDCQAFIEKLNEAEVGTFGFPTEAEWEYACRAGSQTRFYWGEDTTEAQIQYYAWYGGNNNPTVTKEVGLMSPNAWGFYDMSGNVWEWCHDWYGSYSAGHQMDPQGPSFGTSRVLRGGGWFIIARGCRSAVRASHTPSGSTDSLGFRLRLGNDVVF
jgi:formylglycine-generating enzyme required for sulfatase activity